MDYDFECQARAKQHIDLVEVSPHIQLSGQFLETVETFYVGGKKELKGVQLSVIGRVRSG